MKLNFAVEWQFLHFWLFLLIQEDTGLEYDRYLRQVIKVLEKDPDMRKRMEEMSLEDLKVRQVIGQMLNVICWWHYLLNRTLRANK